MEWKCSGCGTVSPDRARSCECPTELVFAAGQNSEWKRDPINEDWLASVGFKYRDPEERQQWKHWTLTFSERDDHGLYLETTAPGWLNRNGDLVNGDSGWFLWIGRGSQHLHLRHVFDQSEIVAIVEALIGAKWEPTRMGNVRVINAAKAAT